MKFRTEIDIPPFQDKISYRKPILMMGSCFTDNVGSTLQRYLFDVTVNPFGVTYNPESLKKGIQALIHKDRYEKTDLQLHNELWFSFDHYTKFSDPNPEKALEKINSVFLPAKEKLRNAGELLITFGTAFTYKLKETGDIVCNCHKIPTQQFERSLLSVNMIIITYNELIQKLLTINPQLKITFTLSPVRHIKDGLSENQKSKAILRLAIDELLKLFPETCQYFPAYEIMMDDLRDYRFYNEDLVHPNKQAIDYIWEKFENSLLDDEAKNIIQEISPFLRATNHRPLHTNTESYQKFQAKQEQTATKLKEKYPFLHWPNNKAL